MPIYPRGKTSVWIKTPQWVASGARKIPWKKLSGTSGQIPARTRTVINSRALNAVVRRIQGK
jgi:hypothetical protein